MRPLRSFSLLFLGAAAAALACGCSALAEVPPATNPLAAQKVRRIGILEAMQRIMGPLPDLEKRCPLEMKIESETDCGSFVRQEISYQVVPGHRVPAFLLVPKIAQSRWCPGILALHQTSTEGRKIVVGLGKNPDDAYGAELSARGFVVLAPPYPLLADYQPDLAALGFSSGTMLAIWTNIRGLDLLESLPFVSRAGCGCIGHSLGGHNGIFTAAFDDRIKAVVSSCGLDSFRDYFDGDPKNWEPGKGWCQLRYMPKLSDYRGRLEEIPFDFDGVLEAIAPRRIFLNAPVGDDNFRWRSVDRVVQTASRAFALHAGAAPVQVEHPEGGHGFPPEMREKAYQLLDTVLRPKGAPEPIHPMEGWNWVAQRSVMRGDWEKILGRTRRETERLEFHVVSEEKLPEFTRQHVRYQIEEGVYTDGYLLMPPVPPGRKTAGVVVFHSTVASQAKLVAGLDDSASDKSQGVHLAKRGWVVLCPRCFIFDEGGSYQENVGKMKRRHPEWTGMQRMLVDGMRALDVLQSLPEVDPKRLGAIGHSLGAKEVLYLTTFDPRVRVGVFSEGGLGLTMSNWDAPWYLGPQIKQPGWKRDHHELLALMAPRAFLVLAGDSADSDAGLHFLEAARPAYERENGGGNLQFFNHREGHAYPPAARKRAEEFLAAHLGETNP